MTGVRAAVHVHSDWSYDGTWTLPRLAAAFERRGYGVVLTAEHDRDWDAERWSSYREACAAASRPSLLVVPGIEYADPSDTVHVPTWGERFLGAGLPTAELLGHVLGHVLAAAEILEKHHGRVDEPPGKAPPAEQEAERRIGKPLRKAVLPRLSGRRRASFAGMSG